jgi:TolA-binding protein
MIHCMLPSHGESTVENTLSEKVSEVSTQISDSDMPKNMEDQIIYTAEPIESDIQASLLRQQKSVMKQLEQK